MNKQFFFLLLLVASLLLTACSSRIVSNDYPQIPAPEVLSELKEDSEQWWYVRFKMIWSGEREELDFSDNLIIAHQILSPIISEHHKNIRLWRFHRRAVKDDAGHRFSFIFYASPASAKKIFHQIENHPLSKQLLNENIVEQISLDPSHTNDRVRIRDTSDKTWPETIQKSWPYFIMGVSILWLDILNQEAEQMDTHLDIHAQLLEYQKVNERINAQWASYGKHAFFHHINAIFGYEPLEVRY